MNFKKLQLTAAFAALLAVANLSAASNDDNLHTPDLPPSCAELQVPAGHKLAFRTYAIGVQLYRWNGTAWAFVAPIANLYASPDFRGRVGYHYAGPTWEGLGGSSVVGRRVAGCSVDPTAIDWLLLEAVSNEGPGIFRRVTYIQRVNTAAGRAPGTPGAFVGAEARVPYTTEYYFYRAEN
ncbi:MAG: DUF3455 domain-containing protein [Blastocatellia bacterium]